MEPKSKRAWALAEEFSRINAEVIAVVEDCSEAEWQVRCGHEGWTVGVVAHHIANGYDQDGRVARLIHAVAQGLPLPPPAAAGYNEDHAERYANCTRDDTGTLLRQNGTAVVALIRALSDTELERTYYSPSAGQTRALGHLIDQMFIAHAREHLASVRETLDTSRSMSGDLKS